MRSSDKENPYRRYQELLLGLARDAISHGLQHGRPPEPNMGNLPPLLRELGASFVTLRRRGELRGCIGSLEARRPLAADILINAYAAAFEDPRFAPLTQHELSDLDVSISILSPLEPMTFTSEEDLLRQIVPFEDGLVLEDERHRGTFLPSVWESLPEPIDFLRHLKQKAGLHPDYWSDAIRVQRYSVFHLPDGT